jgi:predicted nucleotidyltransferase component of viral defense system
LAAQVFSGDDLRDIAETSKRPVSEVERDCLLVTIARDLSNEFPDQLCFKGGFVLRHVLGQDRLSKDVDATRDNPPGHKLDAVAVAAAVRAAGRPLAYRLKVRQPATDSGRSLDFDSIAYEGPCGGRGYVSVEISYREAVVLQPVQRLIGPPFYEPFPVPTMADSEIVAEKLRALAQRLRPTDLSDIAYLLSADTAAVDTRVVGQLVPIKFKLAREGDWEGRVRANVDSMERLYEAAVRSLAPSAMAYDDARRLLLGQLPRFFGR